MGRPLNEMHMLTLNNSALQPTGWQARPTHAGLPVVVTGSHSSVKTAKDLRPSRTSYSLQFRIKYRGTWKNNLTSREQKESLK